MLNDFSQSSIKISIIIIYHVVTEQPDAAAVPQEVKGSGLTLKEEDVNKATFVTKSYLTSLAFVFADERWKLVKKRVINVPVTWHMHASTKPHCSMINWT